MILLRPLTFESSRPVGRFEEEEISVTILLWLVKIWEIEEDGVILSSEKASEGRSWEDIIES